MQDDQVAAVLDFWFAIGREPFWFEATPDFDREIGHRFGHLVERSLAGGLDDWVSSPDGTLARIILLDQFPRNLFRGTPRAFAGDPRARPVARAALLQGFDRQRPARERVFYYLPLGHSKDLEDQNEAVRLAELLGNDIYLERAREHRDVIVRFGRFPHRNAILGRDSTDAELAFLAGTN